ncbi:PH domain-containing protein [Lacticigenium naphthae]|uniref:PH domain-containing protein n=1 Tax=Lacticigenium naphthae TaxID=515351 RepID=UPI0004218275|nr:PH domain-containing protein [Lacticigenium naphthae]
MDYPLLKNQLPESIKSVWKKTSLITFIIFMLAGIGVIGGLTYFDVVNDMWKLIGGGYFALIVLFYLLNFFLIRYRYEYFRYEITSTEVVFQQGFIFRSITYVPFSRIQHIETEQGPFLRREKLMELVIHTAATNHHIAGLAMDEAQLLRQNLLVKVEETGANEYGA